jgi:hypothetical protein
MQKGLAKIQTCYNLAPSSFCVYLFGLESLAAMGGGTPFFLAVCLLFFAGQEADVGAIFQRKKDTLRG